MKGHVVTLTTVCAQVSDETCRWCRISTLQSFDPLRMHLLTPLPTLALQPQVPSLISVLEELNGNCTRTSHLTTRLTGGSEGRQMVGIGSSGGLARAFPGANEGAGKLEPV